jgi:hypothetical protein
MARRRRVNFDGARGFFGLEYTRLAGEGSEAKCDGASDKWPVTSDGAGNCDVGLVTCDELIEDPAIG